MGNQTVYVPMCLRMKKEGEKKWRKQSSFKLIQEVMFINCCDLFRVTMIISCLRKNYFYGINFLWKKKLVMSPKLHAFVHNRIFLFLCFHLVEPSKVLLMMDCNKIVWLRHWLFRTNILWPDWPNYCCWNPKVL